MTIYAHVPGAAIETEVRKLMEEWRVLCPSEYAAWDANCRAQRELLRDVRAFSAGRTLQFACTLPAHVHLKLGRFLGDHNWSNDPKVLEIVLSVVQNAKMYREKA